METNEKTPNHTGDAENGNGMTLEDAVLKSLEDIVNPADYMTIYKHINSKKYCKIGGNTPWLSVSGILSKFIIKGDIRVKRIRINGSYLYYLTNNEEKINFNELSSNEVSSKESSKEKDYTERDLHPLLATFLIKQGISSKTIFHEESSTSKDKCQKWVHPDMVGIEFLKLKSKINQEFLKTVNRKDTFKLYSYEIKKKITNDNELKEAFFQAVSNSSWANYGYLVAFDINESKSLLDEMERLNQSFGIGIIKLKENPHESKFLFASKFKDLDFRTIDKICNINESFQKFIEHIESVMTAEEKHIDAVKKDLEGICDKFLENDEIKKYCKEHNIPMEDSEEQEK